MIARRRWLAALAGAFALVSGARAAEPADEELLEFLGTLDAEDAEWMEYLATTDVATAARDEKKPAPPRKSKREEVEADE